MDKVFFDPIESGSIWKGFERPLHEVTTGSQDNQARSDPVGRVWNPIPYDDRIRPNTFWHHPITFSVSRAYSLIGSDELRSELYCRKRWDPTDRICRIRHDPVLSDARKSSEFAVSDDRWNKIFTVKLFQFRASEHVGFYWNREVPLVGFDVFLHRRSCHSHLYSVIGGKRKTLWLIGSLQIVLSRFVHVI